MPDQRNLTREVAGRNYWAVVNTYANCSPESCTPQEAQLTADQIAGNYLYQVQSFYQRANTSGIPLIEPLFAPDVSTSYGSALDVLDVRDGCNSPEQPCQWGNYAYGAPNYSSIQVNGNILFCRQYQRYVDYDGNGQVNYPPDSWYEYRFAITHGSAGPLSTYSLRTNPPSPNPPWLTDADTRPGVPWLTDRPQRDNLIPTSACFN